MGGFTSLRLDSPVVIKVVSLKKKAKVLRMKMRGWIGVDLDGTLAYYTGW